MKNLLSRKTTFPIIGLFIFLASILILSNACDPESDDPEFFDVSFTVTPQNGTLATVFTFTPTGPANAGKFPNVTYSWDFDGDGVFDEVKTEAVSVSHQYSSEGWYTATLIGSTDAGAITYSYSEDINVINDGSCLPNYHTACADYPTVTVAGVVYNTVQIGNRCWMAENLNRGEIVSSGSNFSDNGTPEKVCYDDNPDNCAKYGGLYSWYEAMDYSDEPGATGLCPFGWHIPTKAEWDQLADELGGFEIAGAKMMACEDDPWGNLERSTNASGFTAFPSGYYWIWFEYEGSRSWFWTSDSYSEDDEKGIVKVMDREQDALTEVNPYKYNSACVRCIKDL